MSSSERSGRSTVTCILGAGPLVLAALLIAGCPSSPSRVDSGTGDVDAFLPPGTDAALPPGTDAPLPRLDTAAPAGTVCENTCMYADDMECDDGGPDSLNSLCAFGTDCADCGPRDPATCMPRCTDRTCGDDGCGGTCGECAGGTSCQDGNCCMPDCTGLTCGDDGCGGSCGECDTGTTCRGGVCRTPDCAGRVCGSDGADGRCGPMDGACPDGQGCRDGACVACDCTGRSCGMASGCEMSCGECPAEMALCNRLTGVCSATAMPANCNDTCRFSGDNECDDGRTGSHTALCEPGTDCSDCGPM